MPEWGKLAAEYQRIREAMGVPDDYEIAEADLAMALRHEARTGELPEFNPRCV